MQGTSSTNPQGGIPHGRTPKRKRTGAGRIDFTTMTTVEKHDYIMKRAEKLGWSRMHIFSVIIDKYLDDGAPKLAPNDKVIPVPDFPKRGRWQRIKDNPNLEAMQ